MNLQILENCAHYDASIEWRSIIQVHTQITNSTKSRDKNFELIPTQLILVLFNIYVVQIEKFKDDRAGGLFIIIILIIIKEHQD